MMKFTLVCLSLLAVSLYGRETPSLDFPIPCFEVDRPANEVMEALGFEIQPSGGINATTVFAHVYNTRDWRQVWGQVKRPADTSGGLLPSTTRLRPFVTELAFYDVKPHWLKRGRCTVRLTMDFTGWKETLWAEGHERFRTTGQLEARILDLIRNQVEAKGLVQGK